MWAKRCAKVGMRWYVLIFKKGTGLHKVGYAIVFFNLLGYSEVRMGSILYEHYYHQL